MYPSSSSTSSAHAGGLSYTSSMKRFKLAAANYYVRDRCQLVRTTKTTRLTAYEYTYKKQINSDLSVLLSISDLS